MTSATVAVDAPSADPSEVAAPPPGRSLFHEPWWLDAVAPGAWEEVTVERDGETIARLPYLPVRRFGLRTLVAPPLCNRLGPLVDAGEGKYVRRLSREGEAVGELLELLPRHDVFRQSLRPELLSWYPLHRAGARVEPRISYVLDDLSDLDAVWADVRSEARRTIRKAEAALTVTEDDDGADLAVMAAATFARQRRDLPFGADLLHRVVRATLERGRGLVLTARDEHDQAHASVFVAWEADRAWYLVGGADPALRSSGATSLLLWEAVKRSADHVPRFDFEGSMVPGIERSFRNFGGRQETYHAVTLTSRRGGVAVDLHAVAERWRAGRS